MPTPSRDAARAAFDKLNTNEKSAFLFEATFNTIGQALEETGRRVADLFESFDIDDLFTQEGGEEKPAEPASKAASATKKASPRKKTSPRKTSTPRAKSSPSKTAGKPKPTDDDEA